MKTPMKTIINALVCAALCGCASDASLLRTPEAALYRCQTDSKVDVGFTVRFADDSATINSNRGYEVLYRTAGGLTPSQTVYGNPRMRGQRSGRRKRSDRTSVSRIFVYRLVTPRHALMVSRFVSRRCGCKPA